MTPQPTTLLVAMLGMVMPCSAVEAAGNTAGEILPPRFIMPMKLPERAKALEFVRISGRGGIKPFLAGKCEVTQAQYQAVMGTNPSAFALGHDHPVETVNWHEAEEFCRRLTAALPEPFKGKTVLRLPTDEEWSLAAALPEEKGSTPKEKDFGNKELYPWGKEWPPPSGAGNYYDAAAKKKHSDGSFIEIYDDGYADTSPVGSFKPNKLGLHDIGGNVWEWCQDWYDEKHETRVLRGASWRTGEQQRLLSSRRLDGPPEARGTYVGFRVVLASPMPEPPQKKGN